MRLPYALLAMACTPPTTTTTDVAPDPDSSDTATPPTPTPTADTGTPTSTTPKIDPACLITLDYTATIVTVARTPFGFDGAVRLEPVQGFFTYDRCVRDTDVFETKEDGHYDHWRRQSGGFEFRLEAKPGLTVVGSTKPVVRIANLDYFYFEDGGEDWVDGQTVHRTMQADGKDRSDVTTWFAIGDGSVDFASDDLPETFPMQGDEAADFACMGGVDDDFCVTFSVRDESENGGTFLMSLSTLTQRANKSEP